MTERRKSQQAGPISASAAKATGIDLERPGVAARIHQRLRQRVIGHFIIGVDAMCGMGHFQRADRIGARIRSSRRRPERRDCWGPSCRARLTNSSAPSEHRCGCRSTFETKRLRR